MDKAKILIVDDDRNILLTLRKALEPLEYDIEEADNGNRAAELLAANAYDCVLLDLRLPDLDGMELLRQFNPQNVIMITAHGTIQNAVEAMKLGCVDFLAKPFDLETVRSTIQKVLERKHISFEQNIQYESIIQLAKLDVQNRHYRNAIEKVRHALELKPDSSDAYNILGVLHEVLGELAPALSAYQTALKLDPNNDSARENLTRMRDADGSGGLKLRF
jgi:DNA-binding NtrC family response regulator